MSETRSLPVMEEGLPDDIESLFALAKLMQVAPNLTARVDEHGFPEDEDINYMYRSALNSAIQNELARREHEKKWRSS